MPTAVALVAEDIVAAIDKSAPAGEDVPATADNIVLLGRWMAMEGGLWADNPLNTDLHAGQYPHQYTSGGSDTGTPIYPNLQIGVEAAAATLLGDPAYGPILAQLRKGSASCTAFADAVIRSPWAASHYGDDPAGFCGASPAGALTGRGRRGGGRSGEGLSSRPHHGKG